MFCRILQNPRIQVLDTHVLPFEHRDADGKERTAFITAIATHPAITWFKAAALIPTTHELTMLSQSVSLTSLDIALLGSSVPGLRGIAHMPQLRLLSLHAADNSRIPLTSADIQAVCEKSLDALSFARMQMDASTLAVAASARAKRMIFTRMAAVFDSSAIDVLCANPYISSLEIGYCHIVRGGASRLAASPTIEKMSLILSRHHETFDSVRRAWVGAGKLRANLRFLVS